MEKYNQFSLAKISSSLSGRAKRYIVTLLHCYIKR